MTSSQSSLTSTRAGTEVENRPEAREFQSQEPELEILVSHLVAAKRSLSSIHHVWRANEIVTAARTAVEESVVSYSRTGFLRRGLNNQLRLLYSVRTEVEDISLRGRAEVSTSLQDLDTAHSLLKKTLDMLRETIVHSAFRPAGEGPKSLHDFVDESGLEDLNASLKASIYRTNDAQAALEISNNAFDDELRSIKRALGRYRTTTKPSSSSPVASSTSSSSASDSNVSSLSSMPSMLQSLEMHAQEMASLLESLVRHFDLCVTAVKHTEGGGAAARSITGDLPLAVKGNNRSGPSLGEEMNANLDAPLEPVSQSEYHEMKAVIVKDASEADDVVVEIQDRIEDMESTLESVLVQRDNLSSVYRATTGVFRHLSSLAMAGLPGYISRAHNFSQVWSEEYDHINVGLGDLSDLRTLYEGFLDAYDGLILEVTRRKHVRQRVGKVLLDTRQKLDQLYEEDVNARESFRVKQGDYLPSDIWLGVNTEPTRVEIMPADDGENIPELPRQVIEQSLARLNMWRRRST